MGKPTLELLDPVARPSVKDAIVERLCSYISAHGLEPGAQLPPEMEIATALGVSRSSVREAISGMVASGLCERRSGDGTYLTSRMSSLVIRPLALRLAMTPQSIADIIGVRRAIEAECAYLAAERATPAQIDALDACLNEIAKAGSDTDAAAKADFALHIEIARIAGNPILFDVLSYLSDLIYQSHLETTRAHGTIRPAAQSHHVRIVDAIKRGNADTARRLMLDHLYEVERSYRDKVLRNDAPTSHAKAKSGRGAPRNAGR